MGYESKLFIVEKTEVQSSPDKKTYASIIATFDLCKMGDGPFMDAVKNAPATNHYIYADDGNTQIIKDQYGDALKEMSIEDALNALIRDYDGYRRVKTAIALLMALDCNDYSNLAVLHFGH